MNKKGIIFTIDALIALTVFIVVVIVIYSMITPNQSANIQGSSIYANAENFLRAEDTGDLLADAFKEWQVSGASAAETKLRNILDDLDYRANMRVYQKDDQGNVIDRIMIEDYDFDSSIVIRKSSAPKSVYPTPSAKPRMAMPVWKWTAKITARRKSRP